LNISFIPLIYFCYPETKGVTLEQIDHIFIGKGHGWSGLTQGVKESIHAKKETDQHAIEVSDVESRSVEREEKDSSGNHVESAVLKE
jgi:hypothetical protein